MPGEGPHPELLASVETAFRSLPDRYLGADAGFDSTVHLRLGDVGHTWEIRCGPKTARVRRGVTKREPDVTISTDAATWLRLREGELSGLEAFRRRLLSVRGNLDQAVGFEGLFRLPNGRPPLLQIHDVPVGRHRVSTLTMGSGPDVLLLHGLGGTRASLFETAADLSPHYRVHAIDLPGFGSSSKPALGAYNARWFADIVLGLLDELGIARTHMVGNSMGGRVAIEVGLRAPERVSALGLLCPGVAFVRRGLHPIVRLLRPEFGMLPHTLHRSLIASQFWAMFHDRDRIDPEVGALMVEEFRRIYASRGARYAFLSSARNIYLEEPFGRQGFYPRLAGLEPPALFVWGSHDPLIPAAFGRHVRQWLPSAEQVIMKGCGHVPQVERPEECHRLLLDFFARAEAAQDGPAARLGRGQARAA
ncbi:MAG TPA: alpha/beta fold hydrolase [Solirubrobacteraceae bacterium]|nr:alpha/beta fold hydrolase [Solirubrobacteraceae bacterium]